MNSALLGGNGEMLGGIAAHDSGFAAGARRATSRGLGFAFAPDTQPGKLILNRKITLKDTWASIAKKGN